MKVLITGASNGIGRELVCKFLKTGNEVYGLDLKDSNIQDENYHHFICDISDKNQLPFIENINVLINNAGVQNSGRDIEVNLKGSINVTEKYAFQKNIKSVLFNASASAHTGFEFAEYSASKAGLIGYMKNCAWRLAEKYKATCNSISLGGVITHLNDEVMNDNILWDNIMKVTPLKKWINVAEVAEWVYFITVCNKSMTGQDVLIDNGEKDLNCTFVWPDFQ